jgi:hypothetical protein
VFQAITRFASRLKASATACISAAAVVELTGGAAARKQIHREEEFITLQGQITAQRDQLQRESLAYGELRARAARHEAVALDALARLDETEARERKHLRDLGTARQRVMELSMTNILDGDCARGGQVS